MRSVDNNAWNTWWDLSQIMLTKSNEERKKRHTVQTLMLKFSGFLRLRVFTLLRNVIMCGVLFFNSPFFFCSPVSFCRWQIFRCTYKMIWYMSWPSLCVHFLLWEPNLCQCICLWTHIRNILCLSVVFFCVCVFCFCLWHFRRLCTGHFMTLADLSDLYDKNSVVLYIFFSFPQHFIPFGICGRC